MNEKNGMIFYLSWLSVFKALPPADAVALVTAILEYGTAGKEPDAENWKECQQTAITAAIFEQWKPVIDSNKSKYDRQKDGRRLGAYKTNGILPQDATLEDMYKYESENGIDK